MAPLAKMSGAHQINGTHHLPPVSGLSRKGNMCCASVLEFRIYDLIAAAVSGFYVVGASLGEVRLRFSC